MILNISLVTFVCDIGESKDILDWYRMTCGMERFFISEQEEPGSGSIIEDVGLKLTVGSWLTEWLCREEGVTWTNDQDDIRYIETTTLPIINLLNCSDVIPLQYLPTIMPTDIGDYIY